MTSRHETSMTRTHDTHSEPVNTQSRGERPLTIDTPTTRTSAQRLAATALVAVSLIAGAATAEPRSDAQTLSWQDGLSQTTVFAIHHDREGAVWFGTEDGLNRFDGSSFKVYRHDRENTTSLPANTVRSLAEGLDGRIWVGTEGGGVAAFDPDTESFVNYRRGKRGQGLASNYTRSVVLDGSGLLWVATRDAGLDRLDPATGLVTNFRHDPTSTGTLSSDRVYALHRSVDGSLFAGTNRGLDRFDTEGERFERVDLAGQAPRIRAIFEDAKGNLWIGTRGSGLFSLNLLDGAVQHFSKGQTDRDGDGIADIESDKTMSSDNVQTILEDDFGQLWIGTEEGLNLLDRSTGLVNRYGKVDISATGGSGSVTSLHADDQGSLWVGTELGGLIRWDGPQGTLNGSKGKSTDIVTSFTQDKKGALYFGTVGKGLAKVRKNGKVKYFSHDPDVPASLSDDRVMSLFTDSRGGIWVGTMKGGLAKFSPGRKIFKSYRHDENDPTSLSSNGVMTIHEDPQGRIWVGTFGGGLNLFHRRSKSFTAFRHDANNPASLASDRITAIRGTASGLLWIGSDGGGLSLFDPATGATERFEHDPLDPTSLPADTVCALYVDHYGALWVGTRGGGIAKMIGDSFLSFSEADGLPNSVVYAIQPDLDGKLWLSTNNGLSRFDPVALSFDNFDVNDGLQANEFNFGASYRSAEGELFFGGIKGYNSLAPQLPVQTSGDRMAGEFAPRAAAGL